MSSIAMAADSTQSEHRRDLGKTYKKKDKAKKKKKEKGKKTIKKKKDNQSESDHDSDLDLSKELKPIGAYVQDRENTVEHMFRSISGKKLKAMLPEILKTIAVDDLKRMCIEQLECMSKKRIQRLIQGADADTISSSGTDDDDISTSDFDRLKGRNSDEEDSRSDQVADSTCQNDPSETKDADFDDEASPGKPRSIRSGSLSPSHSVNESRSPSRSRSRSPVSDGSSYDRSRSRKSSWASGYECASSYGGSHSNLSSDGATSGDESSSSEEEIIEEVVVEEIILEEGEDLEEVLSRMRTSVTIDEVQEEGARVEGTLPTEESGITEEVTVDDDLGTCDVKHEENEGSAVAMDTEDVAMDTEEKKDKEDSDLVTDHGGDNDEPSGEVILSDSAATSGQAADVQEKSDSLDTVTECENSSKMSENPCANEDQEDTCTEIETETKTETSESTSKKVVDSSQIDSMGSQPEDISNVIAPKIADSPITATTDTDVQGHAKPDESTDSTAAVGGDQGQTVKPCIPGHTDTTGRSTKGTTLTQAMDEQTDKSQAETAPSSQIAVDDAESSKKEELEEGELEEGEIQDSSSDNEPEIDSQEHRSSDDPDPDPAEGFPKGSHRDKKHRRRSTERKILKVKEKRQKKKKVKIIKRIIKVIRRKPKEGGELDEGTILEVIKRKEDILQDTCGDKSHKKTKISNPDEETVKQESKIKEGQNRNVTKTTRIYRSNRLSEDSIEDSGGSARTSGRTKHSESQKPTDSKQKVTVRAKQEPKDSAKSKSQSKGGTGTAMESSDEKALNKMAILELEMRARAIKAMLRKQEVEEDGKSQPSQAKKIKLKRR